MEDTYENQKQTWLKLYETFPQTLQNLQNIEGVVSAFNVNIDAVIHLKSEKVQEWIQELNMDLNSVNESTHGLIKNKQDVVRAFVNSFKQGSADEQLVESQDTFIWLMNSIGLQNCRNQMGGQAGIIANVMSVCGVKQVYSHTVQLPKSQSEMFVDLPNLKGVDDSGKIKQIREIVRQNDIPLIHFILEFKVGDELKLSDSQNQNNSVTIQCTRSNRFIATYDPNNFDLEIDNNFITALSDPNLKLDFILLSGYQLMRSKLIKDGSSGLAQVDRSWQEIYKLKQIHSNLWVHLELAETHDRAILKQAILSVGKNSDSLGLNEVELVDALEVLEQHELAEQCKQQKTAVVRYQGLKWFFEYMNVKRIQLHFFGLYLTLCQKNLKITTQSIRDGHLLAATIAAGKAGTGTIEKKENLQWAKGQQVHNISLDQLNQISDFLQSQTLKTTGIHEEQNFFVVATPSIIVDKPITLVGMGDTISSLSLVGAGLQQK